MNNIFRVCCKKYLRHLRTTLRKQSRIIIKNLRLPFGMHAQFWFINKYNAAIKILAIFQQLSSPKYNLFFACTQVVNRNIFSIFRKSYFLFLWIFFVYSIKPDSIKKVIKCIFKAEYFRCSMEILVVCVLTFGNKLIQ